MQIPHCTHRHNLKHMACIEKQNIDIWILILDGGVSEWVPPPPNFGPCDKICQGDVGEQVRRRTCSNPPAQCGGLTCEGKIGWLN